VLMLPFLSIFLYSTYSDLTIDTKNRVLLLSTEGRIVQNSSGSVRFSLDSIFAPLSISSSFFSVWVTSISENKSQKYSLWGDFMGKLDVGGKDIDADEKGVLIAGEDSYLIQTVSGVKITVTKKETERCAISGDSLYLYGDDSIYVFKRNGDFVRKKFVPAVKDICIYRKNLCFLFNDSLVLGDSTLRVQGGKRMESGEYFLSILTDSGIVYYPKAGKTIQMQKSK
jgi:hypothetical protein